MIYGEFNPETHPGNSFTGGISSFERVTDTLDEATVRIIGDPESPLIQNFQEAGNVDLTRLSLSNLVEVSWVGEMVSGLTLEPARTLLLRPIDPERGKMRVLKDNAKLGSLAGYLISLATTEIVEHPSGIECLTYEPGIIKYKGHVAIDLGAGKFEDVENINLLPAFFTKAKVDDIDIFKTSVN